MYNNGMQISLQRDCEAIMIPDGIPVSLYHGDPVHITQVLGGMFTVVTNMGSMVRIDGKDADALGQTVPDAAKPVSAEELNSLSMDDLVKKQLASCYDPEIPVNIMELGLVYECNVHELEDKSYLARVQMTLTAPGCGMGEVLKQDVERKIRELPAISTVEVELVFDPAWDQSMMTEAARLQLGML